MQMKIINCKSKCSLFRAFICLILLLCLTDVHADRIVYSYDSSGNRLTRHKEIVIRRAQQRLSDEIPRKEDLSQRQITIYPNPTEGLIRVEISGDESFEGASITIYDSSGKIVYYDNELEVNNDIDLTTSPNGIYLLIIRIDGETSSWKISKI